jgi:predicted DNA-binding transcriptional regulator AlpA
MTESKLLGLRDTAERLNVPEQTLRYWRHLGEGPQGVRFGRRVMFRVEDIDRWVAEKFDAAEKRT